MLSTTSSTTIAEDKAALRRQVCLTLECLSPEAVRRGDDALFAAFSALPQVEAASTLFAFWGIPGREQMCIRDSHGGLREKETKKEAPPCRGEYVQHHHPGFFGR